MNNKEFRRIRRRELDMTQEELATSLGLTVRTITNYENGHAVIPRAIRLALDCLRMLTATTGEKQL